MNEHKRYKNIQLNEQNNLVASKFTRWRYCLYNVGMLNSSIYSSKMKLKTERQQDDSRENFL